MSKPAPRSLIVVTLAAVLAALGAPAANAATPTPDRQDPGVSAYTQNAAPAGDPASLAAGDPPYCSVHVCTYPASYPISGVDTSHYQHQSGSTTIDWSAVHADGIKWAEIKATQGTTVDDAYFLSDMAAARAAGVDEMPYHFWDHSSGSGAQQAAHFIGVVRGSGYTGHRPGDLPPMLDLEGCSTQTTLSNVQSFLDAVQSAFGRTPVVYTSAGEYSRCLSVGGLGAYPLVVAHYGASTPRLPTGWSSWIMWQWSDYWTVNGITGHVDGDVFNGTQSDLDKLAGRHGADVDGNGYDDIVAVYNTGELMW
ncbi:glycoside hydrolase family 25 protein, partial [Rugosimonospora africana]|uniref:glycoside hydrolase family 25 protein n=1 Tax=Rugosimonospora africana TaxID=556532 RepID=UPI001944E82D